MKRLPEPIAVITALISIVLFIIHRLTNSDVLFTLSLLFGVIAYHFIYKIVVARFISKTFDNKIGYDKAWFREKKWEKKVYKILNVKSWKDKLPTENETDFSIKDKTIEEIIGATCQAELDHGVNQLFSLVPLIIMAFIGYPAIFIPTTALSFVVEIPFIFVQRYNRPRLIKILEKQKKAV